MHRVYSRLLLLLLLLFCSFLFFRFFPFPFFFFLSSRLSLVLLTSFQPRMCSKLGRAHQKTEMCTSSLPIISVSMHFFARIVTVSIKILRNFICTSTVKRITVIVFMRPFFTLIPIVKFFAIRLNVTFSFHSHYWYHQQTLFPREKRFNVFIWLYFRCKILQQINFKCRHLIFILSWNYRLEQFKIQLLYIIIKYTYIYKLLILFIILLIFNFYYWIE